MKEQPTYRDKSLYTPDSQDAADALKAGVTDPSQVLTGEEHNSRNQRRESNNYGLGLLFFVACFLLALFYIVYVITVLLIFLIGYFAYRKLSVENKQKVNQLANTIFIYVFISVPTAAISYFSIIYFAPEFAYEYLGVDTFGKYESFAERIQNQQCYAEGRKFKYSKNRSDARSQARLSFETNDFAQARFHYLNLLKDANTEAEKKQLNYQVADTYRLCGQYEEAFPYYTLSANKGNADAYAQLGISYLNGQGAKKDINKGLKLLFTGAETRSSLANTTLGHMFLTGKLVEKNRNTAIEHFIKAAESNYTDFDMVRASICIQDLHSETCKTMRSILPVNE